MNEIKKQGNSVVELLRILCILMVIAGHYYAHGIAYAMAPFGPETYSLRILAMQLISFGADIANDLFVIITGFYMINSVMKGKRIFKLFCRNAVLCMGDCISFPSNRIKNIDWGNIKGSAPSFLVGRKLVCNLLPAVMSDDSVFEPIFKGAGSKILCKTFGTPFCHSFCHSAF